MHDMFKMFNISHDTHDSHHAHDDHSSIEVKVEDGDIIEDEVGQVALDILELRESIIIIAPLA